MSDIINLEKKIQELQNKPVNNPSPIWNRYNDIYSKMSSDQQAFVLSSDKMKEAEAQLMVGFNLYLFDTMRDNFAQNPKYQEYANQYIDTMAVIAQEYSEKAKHLVDENKAKDEEIARLKEELEKRKVDEDVRRY